MARYWLAYILRKIMKVPPSEVLHGSLVCLKFTMTALSHRLTDIVSQQKGFHISSDPLSRRSDTASKTFSKLSFQNGEF